MIGLWALSLTGATAAEPEPAVRTVVLAPPEDEGSTRGMGTGLKRCRKLLDDPPRGAKRCTTLALGGEEQVVVVFGRRKGRWAAMDLDRDGVWSEDERLSLSRDDGGEWTGTWTHPLSVAHEGEVLSVPLSLDLEWGDTSVMLRWGGARSGELDEHRVQLFPWVARYDLDRADVAIDLDGDGRMSGLERRAVEVGWFRIDGVDYRIDVHPAGDTLTLTPGEREGPILEPGAPAPSFALADVEGERRSVDDHAGRWLLIDFWATWCGPCVANLPDVEELADVHGDQLDVLGIAPDRAEALTGFCEREDIPYPQIAVQWGDDVLEHYQVRGVPKYVLVDPEGLVRTAGRLGVIEHTLTEALGDPAP